MVCATVFEDSQRLTAADGTNDRTGGTDAVGAVVQAVLGVWWCAGK